MPDMLVSDETFHPDKSSEVKEGQPANEASAWFISTIEEVSHPDRSSEDSEEQP